MFKDQHGIQPAIREAFKNLPMEAEADLAGEDSTTGELHNKVNAILAKFRAAGLLTGE